MSTYITEEQWQELVTLMGCFFAFRVDGSPLHWVVQMQLDMDEEVPDAASENLRALCAKAEGLSLTEYPDSPNCFDLQFDETAQALHARVSDALENNDFELLRYCSLSNVLYSTFVAYFDSDL